MVWHCEKLECHCKALKTQSNPFGQMETIIIITTLLFRRKFLFYLHRVDSFSQQIINLYHEQLPMTSSFLSRRGFIVSATVEFFCFIYCPVTSLISLKFWTIWSKILRLLWFKYEFLKYGHFCYPDKYAPVLKRNKSFKSTLCERNENLVNYSNYAS